MDTENIQVGNITNSQGVAIGAGATATVGYTADQVSALLAQIAKTFQPKPFDGRSPYVGLAAFQEEDADRFFGREELVATLVARVKDARALFIAGPSGSGKSSVARAGLMHALKTGALPNSDRWLYGTMQPGRAPLDELGRVVASWANSLTAGDDIRTRGIADDTVLSRWADIALGDTRDRRAILLADQFEEVFTQVSREEERLAFINLLTQAATLPNGRVTVLFVLRSDFVSHCATYPQLNALLNQQFLQVGPMTPDELVSAIARPALEVGLRIDPDLIATIVNDMRDAPGALPLMQFTLDDLFQAQKQKGGVIALTRDDYLARGGLSKALERHADAAFAQLSPDEQSLAQTICAGVVEIGRGNVDTRRTAPFDELIPAGANSAAVERVVQELANARLLTTDERDGKETVTLAHERLIDAWVWLRRLVDENRDAIALQNQIAEDAGEWDQHGRDASYLYTGARLATAREQLTERKLTLSDLAQAFVNASIAAEQAARKRQQRLTRAVIGGLALVAVVFAALAWSAFSGQQQAIAAQRLSRSRELAALALNQVNDFPERALLIAQQAISGPDVTRTFEAEDALRQTLLAWRGRAALRGHTDAVNTAEFSCDGQRIVTASDDGTARLWDVASAKELLQLRGHAGAVESAALSCDGQSIVTAGADKTARVWDARTGQLKLTLTGHADRIERARWSRDGQYIVTASDDGTARVWDAATGTELKRSAYTNHVNDAQFSPDGNKVIVAVGDNKAYVWTWHSETAPVALSGAQGALRAAAFSPDGHFVATVGADTLLRIYRLDDGLPVPRVFSGHTDAVFGVQFSPDGQRLVTASRDQTARIWDVASGREIARLVGHANAVTDAAYSPDGRFIVTAGDDHIAILWDAGVGRAEDDLRGHTATVTSAQFSPDGKRVVTASQDGTARVWNAETGATVWATKTHTASVNSARFSPNGALVVTASADNTARVWDASTGKELLVLSGHSDWVNDAEFSPDSKLVVTASDDNSVRVFDASSGAFVFALLQGAKVSLARFSPDGKAILAVAADRTARVWSVGEHSLVARLQGHTGAINSAQFSPDGKRIVTASDDNTVRVWDSSTGKELYVYRGHTNRVLDAEFSHDGHWIVSGSVDQSARVWDASTGADRAVLLGHLRTVYHAEFAADDTQVVTASGDGTARVWDARTGALTALLRGQTNALYDAEFSPDGTRVVTASQDGTARLQSLRLSDLIAQAQARILRVPPELTCDERRQFLQAPLVCPIATPGPTPRAR